MQGLDNGDQGHEAHERIARPGPELRLSEHHVVRHVFPQWSLSRGSVRWSIPTL